MNCTKCGAPLSVYDTGFYKKLVNRGADKFMCISCTSQYFGITQDNAQKMIENFQRQGCTLFPELKED